MFKLRRLNPNAQRMQNNQIKKAQSDDGLIVRVSIAEQRAVIEKDGVELRSYPVSTSRFGTGFAPGSYKTPTGAFVICEKIGAGVPVGTVFKGRVPTGEVVTNFESEDGDLILSRILRLDGIDEANRNTFERHIYFHGTNQEHLIGTPASLGCIRMRTADLLELFDLTQVGTRVIIE